MFVHEVFQNILLSNKTVLTTTFTRRCTYSTIRNHYGTNNYTIQQQQQKQSTTILCPVTTSSMKNNNTIRRSGCCVTVSGSRFYNNDTNVSLHGSSSSSNSSVGQRVSLFSTTTTTSTQKQTQSEYEKGTEIGIESTKILYENDRIVISYIGPMADGIIHFELNRPNKMNALDIKMFESIRYGINLIKNNCTIRVVIVSGRGKAFCTGLDVKSIFTNPLSNVQTLLHRPPPKQTPPKNNDNDSKTNDTDNNEQLEHDDEHDNDNENENVNDIEKNSISNLAQDVCYLWRTLNVPVICCIHGMCYGGGFQIAMGCDIRLGSSTNMQMSIMESKWGLIPDMAATILLRELNIGIDTVKELTMTGRIFSSIDAKQYGFITRLVPTPTPPQSPTTNTTGSDITNEETTTTTTTTIVDPRTVVIQEGIVLAKEIIQRSPDSIALCKHLYQKTWSIGPSEEYCLHVESNYQSLLIGTWNQLVASIRSLYGTKSIQPWWLPSYSKRKKSYPLDNVQVPKHK